MSCDLVPVRECRLGARVSWRSVFDGAETSYYDLPPGWSWSSLEEPPLNPDFRADLVMNLSNENMRRVVEAMGYELDEDGLVAPISEFCARGTQWLRQHLDKPSESVADVVGRGTRGAVTVSAGMRRGYLNEVVLRAVRIAREGKRRGATHVFIG